MFAKIKSVIEELEINSISEERKTIIQPFIDFIIGKEEVGETVNLNFICTHNSRRSHFAQIWAQVMASHFKVKNVNCFSGGTEATALFVLVKETLEETGFVIKTISEGNNPRFEIFFSDEQKPVIGFSKTFDDAFNPTNNFAAIMTCSQADENCPFIPGSEKRIPITYEDPKEFDNTEFQKEKYKERSMQIASEMYYVFFKIKGR
ncbi:MAG: protein-tyrosine-phosphatase [Flavobacteriaceae bacterium]|nr:protein-tyrosine-phosphatase [Flavobacteriaceae bacterium]